MEFCPKCGGMLLPNGDKIKCSSCDFKKDLSSEKSNEYAVSEKIKAKDNIIMKGEDVETLPTTKASCPKCGNTKASWWLLQTRSADEAPTRFFKCTECKHTWREYD